MPLMTEKKFQGNSFRVGQESNRNRLEQNDWKNCPEENK